MSSIKNIENFIKVINSENKQFDNVLFTIGVVLYIHVYPAPVTSFYKKAKFYHFSVF